LYCSDGLIACRVRRKTLYPAQDAFDEFQVKDGLLVLLGGTRSTAQRFRGLVDEFDACNEVSHREAKGHSGHAVGERCTWEGGRSVMATVNGGKRLVESYTADGLSGCASTCSSQPQASCTFDWFASDQCSAQALLMVTMATAVFLLYLRRTVRSFMRFLVEVSSL
jgi:hypothetical protein